MTRGRWDHMVGGVGREGDVRRDSVATSGKGGDFTDGDRGHPNLR
jgi:hypothetical protein